MIQVEQNTLLLGHLAELRGVISSRSKEKEGCAEEEKRFAVENVMAYKKEEHDGRLEEQWCVKWWGYDASYNTWEPRENVEHLCSWRLFEARRQ